MIFEIFIKGFVGLIFLLTLKMGLKRRKVENHWYRLRFANINKKLNQIFVLFCEIYFFSRRRCLSKEHALPVRHKQD